MSEGDELMLEMERAYQKGISPYQFRKSDISDIRFIIDYNDIKRKMQQQKKHDRRVQAAMEAIKTW